ncbi:MAG: hypothetical protein LH632_06000 [Rhodoferax sp.]|nr:hypothetical protein [Rhodoferax sp.]
MQSFQPASEHCWIAEVDGENADSPFVECNSANVVQLRLLILPTPPGRPKALSTTVRSTKIPQ